MIEAIELLKELPLGAAVVSGDATFIYPPIIEAIRERGADTSCSSRPTNPSYRPRSRASLATFLPRDVIAAVPGQSAGRRDPADLVRTEMVEKGHGRIEIRRIRVRSKLHARLDEAWPGLEAICRIERTCEFKALCSREVIYAITSLDPSIVGPARRSTKSWAGSIISRTSTTRASRVRYPLDEVLLLCLVGVLAGVES